MAQSQVNNSFLTELFKGCLTSKTLLETTQKHLEYHYIPDQHHKLLFQKISQQYDLTGELPTIGTLSQYFSGSNEVLKILEQVKKTQIIGKQDILLDTFERFLVDVKFVDLYTKIGNLHNEGKKEEAIKLLGVESQVISNFSIKDNYYTSVFANFDIRQQERKKREQNQSDFRIPFSMHPTDHFTKGGMNVGTSTLLMARSGVGKTTAKRWIGASAARLGYRVAHFQCEGTEDECLDAYDACWTSVPTENIELGIIPLDLIKKIEKARKDVLASKGEVYIKASESFDEMSINDCKDVMEDLERIHGKIHLAIFDYAELFTVKGKYYNSESGERKRREDISNKITSIATSFKCAALTSTQASDIKPEKWNNPNYVMTRSDISEFKGFIKPFSGFITLNQTEDEYNQSVIRLYHDKFRKVKWGQTYRIAQSLDNGRFYDSQRTLELFWDENSKQIKK